MVLAPARAFDSLIAALNEHRPFISAQIPFPAETSCVSAVVFTTNVPLGVGVAVGVAVGVVVGVPVGTAVGVAVGVEVGVGEGAPAGRTKNRYAPILPTVALLPSGPKMPLAEPASDPSVPKQ